MKKQYQIDLIRDELKRCGYASRNSADDCRYGGRKILRLASIMGRLKKEFEWVSSEENNDCIYRVVDRSRDQVEVDLATSNLILKYQ